MNKFILSGLILMVMFMLATGEEIVMYAKVGERVTLTGPAGQKYITWYYNKKNNQIAWTNPFGGRSPNKDNFSLSGNSLVIDNIQQFGTFYCDESSTNDVVISHVYKVFQLKVSKTPDSLLLPGESLSLGCDVEGTERKPPMFWLSPQKEWKTNPLKTEVTSKDNGLWQCVVNEGKRVPVSVEVVGFSPSLVHQYTSVNSPLTVPCSLPPHISWKHLKDKGIKEVQWHFVPSSSAPPEMLFSLSLEDPITWKPADRKGLHPASDAARGNLSITKKKWQEADRGNYVCSMKFQNDLTLSTTVQVKVLQISSFPGPELIAGKPLNLSCSTGDLLPANMQLKWIPPEKSSFRRSDRHHANLIIPKVATSDKGRWRCELRQNNTLLTSATITLKIDPILSVWMLVIICGAAVILILLLVLTFILCRRRQRKTRHLRHKLCRCKNPKPKGFYRT